MNSENEQYLSVITFKLRYVFPSVTVWVKMKILNFSDEYKL